MAHETQYSFYNVLLTPKYLVLIALLSKRVSKSYFLVEYYPKKSDNYCLIEYY